MDTGTAPPARTGGLRKAQRHGSKPGLGTRQRQALYKATMPWGITRSTMFGHSLSLVPDAELQKHCCLCSDRNISCMPIR